MNKIIDHLVHPVTLLLVVLLTAEIIRIYIPLGDPGRKVFEFGAVLASGVGIIYTVLLTIQTKRAGSALRFAERWNDVDFTTARKQIGEVMRKEKTLSNVDRVHIVHLLNFFEEMSISIQEGESQEQMLRKFFIGVVVDASDTFRPWILAQRSHNPTVFKEYLWLADRWKPVRNKERRKNK